MTGLTGGVLFSAMSVHPSAALGRLHGVPSLEVAIARVCGSDTDVIIGGKDVW